MYEGVLHVVQVMFCPENKALVLFRMCVHPETKSSISLDGVHPEYKVFVLFSWCSSGRGSPRSFCNELRDVFILFMVLSPMIPVAPRLLPSFVAGVVFISNAVVGCYVSRGHVV